MEVASNKTSGKEAIGSMETLIVKGFITLGSMAMIVEADSTMTLIRRER